MTDHHDMHDDRATSGEGPDDEAIRVLVGRLARPHRSGGGVIERASLLAAGADFKSTMVWIEAHGGKPEPLAALAPQRGLHSSRLAEGAGDRTPLRFILPAAALS